MAKNDTYTTGLKNFIANNQVNAGYVTTETNISSNDLVNRIQQIINDSEAGYVQRSELKRVAFSNSFNDLFDKPTLLSICSSASINDLVDFPQLDPIATTGDWEYIKNKPTIPEAINMNDVDLEIDTKVGDAISALKGANLGNDYNTLVKLQNKKSEVIYIDVIAAPYNLINFGRTSFIDSMSHVLIDDIIENYILNKIIILQGQNENFIVTSVYSDNNYKIANLQTIDTNLDELITEYNQLVEPEETQNNFILNRIKLTQKLLCINYSIQEGKVFYLFSSINLATIENEMRTISDNNASIENTLNYISDTISNINDAISDLITRVTILEGYHEEEPEPGEGGEPEPEPEP